MLDQFFTQENIWRIRKLGYGQFHEMVWRDVVDTMKCVIKL